VAEQNELRSLQEVAALMRDNLPTGLTAAEFGKLIGWGEGSDAARARIATLTVEELREIGVQMEQAINWAIAYESVQRLSPRNPSAAGLAQLMRHAASLLAQG
jgi:hypothetical protein